MGSVKMIGITPGQHDAYDDMRKAGLRWLRMGLGFPYRDPGTGRMSGYFERNLARIKSARSAGFHVLGGTGGPGSMRYDEAAGQTVWKSGVPAWAGEPGTGGYYRAVENAAAELAVLAKGLVDIWQVANEPDIDIFRGPLSDSQMAQFLKCVARGVKKGNPQAQTGINIGELTDYSRMLLGELYGAGEGLFDYIGLDGYFGSWQPGGPDSWIEYIDKAYALTGKPVLVNEWGYSSLGESPHAGRTSKNRYNQDVCRTGAWPRVWKKEHSRTEQAEYIRACLKIFASHPHVRGNFFFKWSDDSHCWQCGEPDCPAECAWGLVDVHGSPKEAYYSYRDAVSECFDQSR
ncbi:MAG: hypothetical protein ACM3WV_01505 [Bacillota bacterium]